MFEQRPASISSQSDLVATTKAMFSSKVPGEKLESMMIFIQALGLGSSSFCRLKSPQGAAQMKTRVGDEIGLMRKGSIFGEALWRKMGRNIFNLNFELMPGKWAGPLPKLYGHGLAAQKRAACSKGLGEFP